MIIIACVLGGITEKPGVPSMLSAVAHVSAVMASGAMTVADGMASAGIPVRGSMMWLNRLPLISTYRA